MSDGDRTIERESVSHTQVMRLEFPAGEEEHSVNIAQHYIHTTEDKARLILQRLVQSAEAQIKGRERMVAPAGILLTLVLTLTTTDFKLPIFQLMAWLFTGIALCWLLVAASHTPPVGSYGIDDCLRELAGDVPDNVRVMTTTTRSQKPS